AVGLDGERRTEEGDERRQAPARQPAGRASWRERFRDRFAPGTRRIRDQRAPAFAGAVAKSLREIARDHRRAQGRAAAPRDQEAEERRYVAVAADQLRVAPE